MRSGAAIPLIFFLIVINSFESISNKTIMLGQFVVLMLAMFRRDLPALADPSMQPAPAERAGVRHSA